MLRWIKELAGMFTGERYDYTREKINGRRGFYDALNKADAQRKNPWA